MKTKKNKTNHSKTIKNHSIIKQLNLITLKQGIKSKNVLSCSFFATKDSYRDFDNYKRNLSKFLIQKNILKDFETRIYVDDSSKDDVLELTKHEPSVTIIQFMFEPFKESFGHTGMFGTFIRFLPLFEKGLETVFVSDIDIPNYYLDTNIFHKMKKEKAQFHYRSYVCYDEFKMYGRPYTILAGTIISFIIFPISLLKSFIRSLINPNKKMKTIIDKLNKDNSLHRLNPKPFTKIPYGIDEVFTNTSLYNYLIKHNISVHIDVDYEYMYRILRFKGINIDKQIQLDYYRNPNKSNFLKMKKVFIENLPKIMHLNKCIKYMYDNMNLFKDSFVVSLVKTGKELL